MKARVVIPVNAVKRTANGTGVLKKLIKPNSIVSGRYVKHGALPENMVVLFETLDGYLIPTNCIMQINARNDRGTYESMDQVQEAVEIEEKDYLDTDKVKEIKEKGILDVKGLISGTKEETKYITNGAIAGGLIMLIVAMYKSKSKFLFSTIGIVAGGYVGKLYNKHMV